MRDIRPDLYKGFNPWDRISDVDAVRSLLAAAGFNEIEVVAEPGSQSINAPDEWWPMVMGSGYRGTIEQLSPLDRERIRLENIAFLQCMSVRSVEANVVYAVAREVATRSTN